MHGFDARRLARPAIVAGLIMTGSVAAQPTAPSAPGLDLAEVVRTTLSLNPDIESSRQRAESSRGAYVAAGAPFDALLQAGTGTARQRIFSPIETTESVIATTLGAQRQFRNGVLLNADISLTRTGLGTLSGAATPNDAAASVTVLAPLMKDRGGVVTAAPERSAARAYQASLLDQRQTTSLRLLTVIVAYWDYLEARRRLDVFVDAERRAERSAEETRALVQADERTNADLTQMLGNLAAKRVNRIAAEQTVVDAWQPLGLTMGLPPESLATPPLPDTDFPALASAATPRLTREQLLESAYGHRPDLASAEESLRATQIVRDASQSDLTPRLDLLFGTGYHARANGSSVGNYFQSLQPAEPRHFDLTAQLNYQFPPANSAARGRLLETSAAYEQQRIQRDTLRRQVAVGVAVAAEALARGEAGMRASEESVRLLGETVQAEQRKFQFGMATLFDVINAQDALTSALLGRIDSQHNYAVAIATLRYQSGTWIEDGAAGPALPIHVLLTPP
jgi:outer membrane protein